MNNNNKIKSIFLALSLLFVLACTKDRVLPADPITPGNPNNPNVPVAGDTILKINEFMASNGATIQSPDTADFPDWIEIYNPTDFSIDIAGYFVTDDSLNLTKRKIPTGSSATIIPSKSFKLIWCINAAYLGPLYVNLGLSSAGEFIGLVKPDTTFMDFYRFGPQTEDVSEGRIPNGSGPWTVLPTPTPGSSNN
jgi:hypothetical protein